MRRRVGPGGQLSTGTSPPSPPPDPAGPPTRSPSTSPTRTWTSPSSSSRRKSRRKLNSESNCKSCIVLYQGRSIYTKNMSELSGKSSIIPRKKELLLCVDLYWTIEDQTGETKDSLHDILYRSQWTELNTLGWKFRKII